MSTSGSQASVARPKNLGWLVGLAFFLLSILYPELPGATTRSNFDLPFVPSNWEAGLFYVGNWGGLLWRIGDYRQWQHFIHSPENSRILFANFAPYSFVPLPLLLSAIIAWSLLVHRVQRPTIWRGLLAVVVSLLATLLLVFLLDVIGGHLIQTVLLLAPRGNLTVNGVIADIWGTSVGMVIWLLLPFLAMGWLFAWWQKRLWSKKQPQPVAPAVP